MHGSLDGTRCLLTPDTVDQRIDANHVAGIANEQRQYGTLFGPSNSNLGPFLKILDRAEHTEFH